MSITSFWFDVNATLQLPFQRSKLPANMERATAAPVRGSVVTQAQIESSDVEQAQRCDEAGQHADAIKHLVAGTRKNDVEATTRLGKRLLIGDRAPHLPNDGARLLDDASRLGGAEAPAILAALYGLGVSARHGLADALASLSLAAERGWMPALNQLRVLAGEDPSPDTAVSDEARALATRIDLSFWTTAPSPAEVSSDPVIRKFADFAQPQVCRWMIDRARGRLKRALVYEALIKKTTTHKSRTNTAAAFNLLETDLVMTLLQAKMCAALGMSLRHLEPISVLHYSEGEQITEHFDFVDPNVPDYEAQIAAQGQRVVTFLIYLNDDYASGETEFPHLGVSHKGRTAEGLYFVNSLADGSADVRTLHAGRPPKDGEKWIISQFVRSRPTF